MHAADGQTCTHRTLARPGRIRALHPRFQLWASFAASSTVTLSPGRNAAGFASWMEGVISSLSGHQTCEQQRRQNHSVDRRLL